MPYHWFFSAFVLLWKRTLVALVYGMTLLLPGVFFSTQNTTGDLVMLCIFCCPRCRLCAQPLLAVSLTPPAQLVTCWKMPLCVHLHASPSNHHMVVLTKFSIHTHILGTLDITWNHDTYRHNWHQQAWSILAFFSLASKFKKNFFSLCFKCPSSGEMIQKLLQGDIMLLATQHYSE